jgi:hypothetical protein
MYAREQCVAFNEIVPGKDYFARVSEEKMRIHCGEADDAKMSAVSIVPDLYF